MGEWPEDVGSALSRFGLDARRVDVLTTRVSALRGRTSYRVELNGGRTVKLRRMDDPASASGQQALRAGLPADFAPVLARDGSLLLEEWKEGTVLDRVLPDEGLVRRAAGVLARLHRLSEAAGTDLPFLDSLAELKGIVLPALDKIAQAGMLTSGEVRRLTALVQDHGSGRSLHCLIHTDLCGENLVLDDAGRLFVIDNEHFRFGPPGMDLARSWYRWGWHRAGRPEWTWFRDAYAKAGGRPEAFLKEPLWRVAAAAVSARLRLHSEAAGEALDCLRALANSS